MNIKTMGRYAKLPASQLLGHTIILVDVLRFSTSAIWAMENGALKVIPTVDPGEAASIASNLGDCLLAGERDGVQIPGFHFGNSPEEFTRDRVVGRNLVFSTTNGTGVVCALEGAAYVLIGGMINCTAVAMAALSTGNDIIIMCAGTDGDFSADDIYAAGAIAETILEGSPGASACDLTRIACLTYSAWKEDRSVLSTTKHYSKLVGMGLKGDVDFCLTKDRTRLVPMYRNGILERMNFNWQ